MTSDTASFETLIKTVENHDINAKGSLREIIQLLGERLESDLSLFSNIKLDKSTLFQSLSESLAIGGQWLLRVIKNKVLISAWSADWIDFINSLEVFYRDQHIPLYNKTLWIWQFLSTEKIVMLEEYKNVSDSTIEIHKLYFEVYLAILNILSEMPKDDA